MGEGLSAKSVILWTLTGWWTLVRCGSEMDGCHSCFKACSGVSDPGDCDCTSPSETDSCRGPYCFSKVEIFLAEKAMTVQKGCSSEIPGNQQGCYHAGSPDSIFCFCQGHNCNSKSALGDYKAEKLKEIECCHCLDPEDQTCPYETCTNTTCTGSYCYFDFISRAQGCGHGFPQLQNFLRTPNYQDFGGETTCARYVAGQRTIVHGCTCSQADGQCNVAKTVRDFDLRTALNRSSIQESGGGHYCYSIHKTSKRPMTEKVMRKAETCEGIFCFISYTTASVAIVSESYDDEYYDDEEKNDYEAKSSAPKAMPVLEKNYELLAGCIQADSADKVAIGCSSEWQISPENPLVKHCICDGHMCNYFFKITGESMDKYKAVRIPGQDPPAKETEPRAINPSSRGCCFSSCGALLVVVACLLFIEI